MAFYTCRPSPKPAFEVNTTFTTYQQGLKRGLEEGYTQGVGIGTIIGFDTGLSEGTDNGYAAGLSVVPPPAIVVIPDVIVPVVTVVSSPTSSIDPLVISVYDNVGLILYDLSCRDRTDGPRLVIYSQGFVHPFNGRSTVTGTGIEADPYIFTLYRKGRWPTGIDLDIRVEAVDTAGNVTVS